MEQDIKPGMLKGQVQVDKTYVGGKLRVDRTKTKGHSYFSAFLAFLGRPRSRRVNSRPMVAAVRLIHGSEPKGRDGNGDGDGNGDAASCHDANRRRTIPGTRSCPPLDDKDVGACPPLFDNS